MRLDFHQVIFVLEDVDAGAREIVMDRGMLAEIEEERAASSKNDKVEEGAEVSPKVRRLGATGLGYSTGMDKLNLSGLLNVLDGVVETPGRMVIMTTNHPEILDPALIRPGRIDKILELGFMEEASDIVSMLQHYYPDRQLTESERNKIQMCLHVENIRITPAQVEQLAMEEDGLPGFLVRFLNYGKEKVTSAPKKFLFHYPGSGSATSETTENGQDEAEELQLDLFEPGDY